MQPASWRQEPGDRQPGETSPLNAAAGSRVDSASLLGRQLGGDLPCVSCRYNLRGLSIRGVCPECGANVRATILSVVDPQATILQPIPRPRLVAAALVLWSSAGLATAVLCLYPYAVATLHRLGVSAAPWPRLGVAIFATTLLTGLGAAGLVRPHGRIPRSQVAAAIIAAILHAPLAYALYHLSGPMAAFTQTRLAITATLNIALILLLLRPIMRLLVARSLLLRSGRVDRQTMLAMAGAAGVMALGEFLTRLSIDVPGALRGSGGVTGTVLIAFGAALLTLGLCGAVVDSARIARAIMSPRRTLRQVVRAGIGPDPGPVNAGAPGA